MKVKVPVLIKDPEVSRYKDLPLVEDFVVEREELFLDGPVSRRLAILDFDADAGALRAGRALRAARSRASVFGRYDVASRAQLDADDFIQASTFGGVLKTLYLFEEPDTLGRAVRWAFDGPQLLVVPRAGRVGQRVLRARVAQPAALLRQAGHIGTPIYACHSHGHPRARDRARGPRRRRARPLRLAAAGVAGAARGGRRPLDAAHGLPQPQAGRARSSSRPAARSRTPSAFTDIAEQFGAAIHPGQEGAARSLQRPHHDEPWTPSEPHALQRGPVGRALPRDGADPRRAEDRGRRPGHAQVAGHRAGRGGRSGRRVAPDSEAVFQTRRKQAGPDKATTRNARPLRALLVAAQRFKRTVLRALDYLPPGDVTFADYGRAMIASDQASHPDSGRPARLADRRVRQARDRRDRRRSSRSRRTTGTRPWPRLDLEELVESDWLAYEFANSARSLLGIPKSTPVRGRVRASTSPRLYYHRDAQRADGAGAACSRCRGSRSSRMRPAAGCRRNGSCRARDDAGHRPRSTRDVRAVRDHAQRHGASRATSDGRRDAMLARARRATNGCRSVGSARSTTAGCCAARSPADAVVGRAARARRGPHACT